LDASLIAAELTECALAGGLGLDADERRRARVRGMDIWARPRPERELGGIPVVAELSGGQVRGRVGPLRFRLELEFDSEHGLAIPHEAAAAASGPVRSRETVVGSSIELLGDPATRYWGLGFLRSRRDVRDVVLDRLDSA